VQAQFNDRAGRNPRAATLASLLACAVSCLTGCHKPTQSDEASAVEAVDGASPEPAVGAVAEVAAPSPIVAADPNIPLHEAVVGTAPLPADTAAPSAPPAAPAVEEQPPQPEADEAWVPGYWWWSPPLARYVWISGAWRHAPPDQVWTPGSWTPADGRFVWAPGYWAPHGYAQVKIDLAPPTLRIDAPTPSPGAGLVWTPGYYGYQDGAYLWIGGSWLHPPSVGLAWNEPRYVGIGQRYYLQPGRWDFAPERRGTVYGPDINVHAGERVRFTPVPHGVVAAHANFVSGCAHAVAMGGRRTPGGGYALPRPGEVREHGERGPGGPGAPEPHGGFAPRVGPEPRHDEPRHETRGPEPVPQHGPAPGMGHPGMEHPGTEHFGHPGHSSPGRH
jgi:hypothetical protein